MDHKWKVELLCIELIQIFQKIYFFSLMIAEVTQFIVSINIACFKGNHVQKNRRYCDSLWVTHYCNKGSWARPYFFSWKQPSLFVCLLMLNFGNFFWNQYNLHFLRVFYRLNKKKRIKCNKKNRKLIKWANYEAYTKQVWPTVNNFFLALQKHFNHSHFLFM